MEFTPSPISAVFKLKHPSNALASILLIPAPTTTLEILVLALNVVSIEPSPLNVSVVPLKTQCTSSMSPSEISTTVGLM